MAILSSFIQPNIEAHMFYSVRKTRPKLHILNKTFLSFCTSMQTFQFSTMLPRLPTMHSKAWSSLFVLQQTELTQSNTLPSVMSLLRKDHEA